MITRRVNWQCEFCDWYTVQFVYEDPARTGTTDEIHCGEVGAHMAAVHGGSAYAPTRPVSAQDGAAGVDGRGGQGQDDLGRLTGMEEGR